MQIVWKEENNDRAEQKILKKSKEGRAELLESRNELELSQCDQVLSREDADDRTSMKWRNICIYKAAFRPSVYLSVRHVLFVPPSPRSWTTFQEGRNLKAYK